MADIKGLGDQLVNLTVKEVIELADYLKEEYGIEPAAAAVAVAGPAAGGDAGAAEEKSEFDVILKAAGGSKLAVVKSGFLIDSVAVSGGENCIFIFCNSSIVGSSPAILTLTTP